ncbi:MAG: AAA family ATPase [Thiotrichaceae bacterium]|nr:AAA family ATPase [Thiotrichaceae bacterium]
MLSIMGYEVSELLYESANSLVYRGVKFDGKQSVILKILKQDYPTPTELTRYQKEYEMTHDLDLAGVVKAYSIEKYQNTLVIILEDFGAESLRQIFEQQEKISIVDFLSLAIQITEALGNIHAANIIHKDINLANIVWNQETHQLKIIDFGIASRLPRENPTLTNPEQLEGTLAYISPEQTGRMNRALDYRTDLYSLGVSFYELLTGKLPFESDSAMELVHCHIAKIPKSVFELNPKIPLIISDIVMKLMAKNADERYQSAFGVKYDLEKVQQNLTAHQDLSDLQFKLAQHDFSGKLHIPQKLYGREHEVNTLLQAFERVSSGHTEMMLVAGYSGVGKTALVHEVHKPMTEKFGYFAAGKFDQFQKNIPYSAITQAFNGLCRYLLKESAETLSIWQTKTLAALGNNGQIIIDVIPDLELIIGKQPVVAQVTPSEAKNRFQMFFLNFVKALCDKKHPLILFIDDLQWADLATLDLLKAIMLDEEIKYLLIIGAYRDNEVNNSHPFIMTMFELQKANAIINTIDLANLLSKNINNLLQDSLKCNAKQIQSLTDLIYQKTQGNAFFTHQFLHTLYFDNLFRFNFEQFKWQWDVEQIATQNITDNVVELMANKINKLPSNTSKALQLAACIGNQFELPILAIIYEHDLTETLEVLTMALAQGLILPLDENYKHPETASKAQFKFLHDRVQQAAYALIDDEQKQIVHLQIGRLLLVKTSESELEKRISDLVHQFNQSFELVTLKEEKARIAELNLIAAKKAGASTAFKLAFNYCQLGIKWVGENSWEKDYKLTLALYTRAVETAVLNGSFEESEKLFQKVLQNAITVLDKVAAYQSKIQSYVAQGKLQDALDIALEILEQLGETFPAHPTSEDIQHAQLKTRLSYADKSIESLIELPEMTDFQKGAVMQIIGQATAAAYIGRPNLCWLLLYREIEVLVKYGNAPEAPYIYSAYGLMLGSMENNIEDGHRFGKLAVKLIEFPKFKQFTSKVLEVVNGHVWHFKKPLRETLPYLEKGYQSGLEMGDFEYVGYNAFFYCCNAYLAGLELTQLEQKMATYNEGIRQVNAETALRWQSPFWQAALNLLGHTDNPCVLMGEAYNQEELLPILKQTNNQAAMSTLYINSLILCYLFEDYEHALENTMLVEENKGALTGMYAVSAWFFYDSLTRLALYDAVSKIEQHAFLEKVIANQKAVKNWANYAPMNHLHKWHLVEAEYHRILGHDTDEILEHYEQAITLAKTHKYVQEQALANELLAKFWLKKAKDKYAKVHVLEAHYHYQQWGAIAKVRNLEQRYPQWLIRESTPTIPATFTSSKTTLLASSAQTKTSYSQWLDLETVMKASQTLSGEIVLSHLLSKMMQIVIENAGAQRGFLILPVGDQWVIEAESAIDKAEVTVLHSLPIETHLPEAIISYVARTQENVVLSDARQEGLYTNNPYIKIHQTQSVLCFPVVYQQQLRAILYFENNLTTGAFTTSRLNTLKMLSSQIAISLENARFVEELETARRQAEVANETKTAFLANVSHELRTPLNAILGYTQLFNRETGLSNLLQEGSQLIEQSSKYLLTLINDIIDISTVERGEISIFPIDIRFDAFLNNLVGIFRHRAKEKGLAFHYTLSPELPTGISCDEKRLRQILTHLLGNAIKFTQTGEIRFTVAQHENNIRFLIEDTGVGIESEYLDKVFLPFEQASDWKHKSEGAGLGLSLVEKLVNSLEGTAQITSQINQGSCFQVDLPLIASNEQIGAVTFLPEQQAEPEPSEDISDEVLQHAVQLLSAEQFSTLYDASMTGDINILTQSADELEKLDSRLMPLVDKIRQAAQVFDTDKIADLLKPLNL